MKYYEMSMDGHLAAVVSDEELAGNMEALEAAGWDFKETKVQAPASSPMIELTCGSCGYKVWLFDNGEVKIEAECDICETKHVLKRGGDGKWAVFTSLSMVPEDQVILHDGEEE